jgi:hypothetical protein
MASDSVNPTATALTTSAPLGKAQLPVFSQLAAFLALLSPAISVIALVVA